MIRMTVEQQSLELLPEEAAMTPLYAHIHGIAQAKNKISATTNSADFHDGRVFFKMRGKTTYKFAQAHLDRAIISERINKQATTCAVTLLGKSIPSAIVASCIGKKLTDLASLPEPYSAILKDARITAIRHDRNQFLDIAIIEYVHFN